MRRAITCFNLTFAKLMMFRNGIDHLGAYVLNRVQFASATAIADVKDREG